MMPFPAVAFPESARVITTSLRRSLPPVVLLGLAAWGSGCVSSRTYVLDTPPAVEVRRVVAVAHTADTTEADAELATDFEAVLTQALAEHHAIGTADSADVVIRYKFVHVNEGSVPVRVVSGAAGLFGSPFYGLGDGSLVIDATFTDRAGRPLARIAADAPIAGFFASTGSGIDDAAGQIAEFLREHFPSEPPAPPLAAEG